jgi:hypothetical protein
MAATNGPAAQPGGTGPLATVSHAFARAIYQIATHPARKVLERSVKGARAGGLLLSLPSETATSLKGALGTEKARGMLATKSTVLKNVAHRNNAKVSDILATRVICGDT